MKYVVRLTSRALRDMEAIYNYVEGMLRGMRSFGSTVSPKQFILWSDFQIVARSSPKTKSFAISSSGTAHLQNYLRHR